jgi:hypothetical protein
MKMKRILLFAAVGLMALTATAQNERYQKAMGANLAKFDSAKTPQDFQALSANFERIAKAEKSEWLAYYYAANAQILYGFMKQPSPENDVIADKAEEMVAKADSLQPNNSELSCLRSMIGTLRMLVNPMQRYMQYAGDINGNIEKAKQQDPANPRPYYLQGQNLRNTPEQFGGGCKTAKPLLEKAMQLYAAFKPASPLHPNWGKAQAEKILGTCQ